jgi:hypothetical protein
MITTKEIAIFDHHAGQYRIWPNPNYKPQPTRWQRFLSWVCGWAAVEGGGK